MPAATEQPAAVPTATTSTSRLLMFASGISFPKLIARLLATCLGLGLMPTRAAVIVGPYLEGATTTNAYVLVECDSTATMTNYYGTTTNYGSTAITSVTKSTGAGTTNVHRIKLTGLTPNTLYHYQLVGQGTTSPDYTFRTPVNPGTNFRFVWHADFRSTPAVHDAIAGRIVNTDKPLFVLEAGDTCANGDWAGWHTEFFTGNEKALGRAMPVYPSPGNHEGWGTLPQAYYQSPDSSGTDGYYSFDCGDLHVIMANFQSASGYASGSAQYNWIQQDVQASLKPWKIFGTHAPAYTYGGSGAHAGDANFQAITSNLLQPNGVKVFLAGHNHFYQHNLVNGIRHLTVGSGGAPLYTIASNATYTVKTIKDNSYLVADVTPTTLHMVIYNNIGTVLDTIDLSKLPAPTSLGATPGSAQVTLAWNAVASATSYTALYGTTAGGPYPTKKTVTTASTPVTGLVNGTPYYFVVTASNVNGLSAISAEALATPTNPAPVVALSSPARGATFTSPATISLAATVTTNSNTINKVQFYNNATNLIGEDVIPPYAFVWPNVSAGSYSVAARVVYNGSGTADSVAANISVTNPPPVISISGALSNGSFTLSGSGGADQIYVLLTASNLPPLTNWEPIATNTADVNGAFRFSDLEATNYQQRFYRIQTP